MRSVFLDAPDWNQPGLLDWFTESRRSAWETFTALPMPGRKDESWRFAGAGRPPQDALASAEGGEPGETEQLTKTAAKLVFVNDRLVSRETTDTRVEVLTLADALAKHGERLRETLVTPDTGLGGQKFAALHHAHLKEATVIVVPAGTEIADPVEILHWQSGENSAAFPRTIILTGANSSVSVLEQHLTSDGAAGFSCGAAQLAAGPGSTLHYTLLDRRSSGGKSIHLSTVDCGRDAQVRHSLVNLGNSWTRTECRGLVTGAGGRSEMFSVALASVDQEIDQRTLQDHLSPHTYSDLLYKNVLFANGRTIFAGLIKVDEGAHQTDAYQKCRNLLLSEDCEANSMPGLEINADQVKCSHGSTSGRIDAEELFYFQSRGISRQESGRLIAVGFAEEVVEKIGAGPVAELVTLALEARFARENS